MSRASKYVPGPGCALVLALAFACVGGCASPLHEGSGDDIRKSILAAQRRELAVVKEQGSVPQSVSAVSEAIGLSPAILAQLEKISGPGSYEALALKLGPSLSGGELERADVTLSRSVMTTVANNLTVQFARLAPGLSEARLIAAESAFDWTLFGSSSLAQVDQARVRSSAFDSPADQRREGLLTLGLRRRMESGGGLTLQQSVQRIDNNSPRVNSDPNPSNAVNITAQIDQPLLRNFGSEATLAEVRLAANADRDAVQQLKATLVQQVGDTESAYWELVRAHGELKIARRLLERGQETRDTLRKRQKSAEDVRASQLSDAVATVEARRADVIRAILAISDTAIRQQLADNARLPLLDMRLQVQVSELDGNIDSAYGQLIDTNYVNYLVGLNYEQPIGNRGAEAAYRGRMIENLQAQLTYREVVQRILLEVKTALRGVVTSFTLIEQSRATRIAAAENLRTLEVEEKTTQNLTPEFLDLKLRRQQALASAELSELAALTEYNAALGRLHAAMGTALKRNQIRFEVESE